MTRGPTTPPRPQPLACRGRGWLSARPNSLTPGLAAILQARPVLTLWLGSAPAGLPGHALHFGHHTALLDAIDSACTAKVGAMRLALGSGVELGDGTLLRGATLDALIGAYPRGFALPAATFRSVNAALARADAGWITERDANACIALVPCTRTAVAQ